MVGGGGLLNYLKFFTLIRIVNLYALLKSVQLGDREGVGAFLLDGVLGCKHEERSFKGEIFPCSRHLPLLHGLHECGLRLGRSPVDLICENHVGEDRTAKEMKPPVSSLVVLEQRGANDVAGHQIGGELNPAEVQRKKLGN